MKRRVAEWLHRYVPAEVASLIGALLGAQLAWTLSGSAGAAAVAGAWGETAAYYSTMLARELIRTRGAVLVTLRELVLEFGVAEALDSLLVRPALMYTAGQLFSDLRLGVLLGKLGADVFFYVPAITAYELRKRQRAAILLDAGRLGQQRG
jgi:hypothetical protein